MARPVKYPAELRQRAVRMVIESRADHASELEALPWFAGKLGIGSPETVRKWLRRSEIDGGQCPGKTTREEISRSVFTAPQ